ncbi:MAG: histidine kinase [Flavobacteriaceae bacterium]|nr:histidine kinase [Flavobacteriaceae bacterium]
MNRFSRYIIQVLLWLGIWSLLWFSIGNQMQFLRDNGPAFVFQILLLFLFIYMAVPQLLFKKKYLLFFIASISAIVLGAYFASEMGPKPPIDKPPLNNFERNPRVLPSRFFIQLLILTISSVIAVLLETFIDAQQKEKSIAIAKAELIDSELKFLKMQINPHFLFNALNNIYALSVTNSNKTQESISTLSEMLRYVIYDCEQPKVPLRKELDYITNYIELFKLKSSNPFDISFTQTIQNDHALVAPMLFVPYIENAFKHSGIEKGKGNYVHISLVQKEHTIEFTVENSIPTTAISTDAQGGIGLPNVQKRLEILYPEKHQLTITKTRSFTVYLKLEIE